MTPTASVSLSTPTPDVGSWRSDLAGRLARLFLALHSTGVVLVAFTVRPSQALTLLLTAGVASILGCGFAVSDRPFGLRARSWLMIGPTTALAMIAFFAVGFLAGPAVLLTLTLMIAGLLLGWRALFGLAIASCITLSVIAWLFVSRRVALPNPETSALSNPVAWFRSIAVMFLAISALGSLMINLVSRLEGSIARTRDESMRREQAEQGRREAELRTLEAQHLENVGRLAAGIAHDFNNNLTAIVGCAELLGMKLAREQREEPLLADLLNAAHRSAELTQQLLVYSRRAQMVRKPVSVHALIEEAVGMFRRTGNSSIALVTNLRAVQPTISADVTLLQSALMNLFVNARDAMPNGGTLTIRTADAHPVADTVTNDTAYVRIEVSDSGEGIPSVALPHIFDPFFTTKPVGKGTGLGLASVAGTVKAHGGHVEATSEPGQGTTIRILLPCIAPAELSVPPNRTISEVAEGELLVVEDDPMVRSTAAHMLRALGYQVTEASDGRKALELVRANGHSFDLVLLDLRMPGLSGETVFNEMQQLDPTLPVVLWSGYAAEQDIEAMLRRGAKGFVQKPYHAEQLGLMIAAAKRKRAYGATPKSG